MLAWLGLSYETTTAPADETPLPGEAPASLAARLALAKAHHAPPLPAGSWLLTADTVVESAGASLGKPENAAEAQAMLLHLRDAGTHHVHTGVALHQPTTGRCYLRRVTTTVWMRAYTERELASYIATGDPFDKAGAYAVQHPDFRPVQRLDRCYANVVGLPLCAVVALLREELPSLERDVRALCRRHLGYDCPAEDPGETLATCAARR